jgi:hypothetical protein
MGVARLTLAIFIVFQIADGLMTYGAIGIFGFAAEGNPLLATWMLLAGAGPALFGAKLIACGCALVLYTLERHKVLAALTTFYFFAAVWPWLQHLSGGVLI